MLEQNKLGLHEKCAKGTYKFADCSCLGVLRAKDREKLLGIKYDKVLDKTGYKRGSKTLGVQDKITPEGDITHFDAAWLGQDNDLFSDNDGLTFHSNFRGVWLYLNGVELFVTPIETTNEYIIFTSPIMLNGKRTNLRFAFIWDDTYEIGGYYKIIGTWNGLDKITGMSDKEITKLKSTDEIQAIFFNQPAIIYADGSESGAESLEEELLPVPKGDYEITEEPLKEKDYEYQFVITDIFGGKHYSYLAHMEMTKTPEEISAGELKDDEYAAYPADINDDNTSIIID